MKIRNIVDKTLHFLVHNSFLFTVAIMCLVHATLLAVTWLAQVTPLVYFNILSVIVYVFCILLCNIGHILPVYISILLEVTIYACVATHYIGWGSGSYCFLCSVVPIIIYFGCFLFKGAKRWIIVLALILNFSVYVYLYVRYVDAEPVYVIPYFARMFLMVFSSFVMVFSVVFYNVIYIYSSEYERVSLEQKNKQLSVDAREDVLTSLLNRRGFLPVVASLMKDVGHNHFCIAFCDIDNFKRINDSYGHDCGDEVLRHMAGLFKKEMQGCDICRWGGEEIVILMKDYDFAVAKEKMEYMRKTIETNPTVFFNKRINATVTIGLEENRDSYHEPEDIIKVADARMYYGKQSGKNIVISEDAPGNKEV